MLKDFLEWWKLNKQQKVDMRRLSKSNLDYEALKRMVEVVSNKDIEIEIKTEDNATITIRKSRENENGYESFADRYNRSRV